MGVVEWYMLIEVKKNEHLYFDSNTVSMMQHMVAKQVIEHPSNLDPYSPIMGCFILHDIELKIHPYKANVYIEFNIMPMGLGLMDGGIHTCIIFDEVPDKVLDQYNNLKKLLDESEE